MTDLGHLLAGVEDGVERAQPHPAAPERVLEAARGTVRRRRRLRHVRDGAVAAASALVLGTAGWFALQGRTAPDPAHTPTPAPSASPSPTADAAPSLPVDLPGMPPMLQASEAVLLQAGAGWFVASYAPETWEPLPDDAEGRSLVLSAPTGELYHLSDTEDLVEVVRWHEPGAVRAEVYEGQVRRAATVDLLTGGVSIDERLPVGAAWVGVHGDDELWTVHEDGGTVLVVVPPQGEPRRVDVPDGRVLPSPDGSLLVVGRNLGEPSVVDVTAGELRPVRAPDGQVCSIGTWLDATGVLATCSDPIPDDDLGAPGASYLDGHHPQLVRLDALGGPPTVLQDLGGDALVPWSVTRLRDGVAVGTAAPQLAELGECVERCDGRLLTWTGDEVAPLTTSPPATGDVCEVRATASGTLLRTGRLCYGATTGTQWWLVDAAGSARLVAPAVDSELGLAPFVVVERDRARAR